MSQTSSSIDHITQAASLAWNASRMKRLSYFSPLGKFLKQHAKTNPNLSYELIKAYLSSSSFSRWVFRLFVSNKVVFEKHVNAAKELQKGQIFSSDNFNLIKPAFIFDIFFNKLRNYFNINTQAPINQPSFDRLTLDLRLLQGANILNEDNLAFIRESNSQNKLNIFQAMQEKNQLNSENFQFIKNQITRIISHTNPVKYSQALLSLKEVGIEDQNLYQNLSTKDHPEVFVNAIIRLKEAGIEDQNLYQNLSTKDHPEVFVNAIIRLKAAGIEPRLEDVLGEINPEAYVDSLLATQASVRAHVANMQAIREISQDLYLEINLPPSFSVAATEKFLKSLKLLQSNHIELEQEMINFLLGLKDPIQTAENFVFLSTRPNFKTLLYHFIFKPATQDGCVVKRGELSLIENHFKP